MEPSLEVPLYFLKTLCKAAKEGIIDQREFLKDQLLEKLNKELLKDKRRWFADTIPIIMSYTKEELIEYIKDLDGMDSTRLEYFRFIPRKWQDLEKICDDLMEFHGSDSHSLIRISVSDMVKLQRFKERSNENGVQ